jgi:membrane-bound lytic murein transglycosylase B
MKLAHAEDSKADWLTRPDVQLFMARIQKEQGYSLETLKQILSGVEIQQSILDAMNHQAERKKWFEYRPIFIQQARIKGGQAFLESNRDALKKASETYGVPIEIITSIVGVETRYGQHAGRHRVVDALATLGFFYPRRSEFFQRELEHFLQLVKEQKFDITTLYGSYAGAMGVPQFIPSSYRHYAVDFDEDGRKDLFDSVSDVVGSVGNYFAQHGWKKDQLVAVKATVSGDSWKDVPSAATRSEFKSVGKVWSASGCLFI